MKITNFIERDEYVTEPYTSIYSIEKELFNRGYIVIKEDKKFIGILTICDLAQNYHQLVIDCYTPKPILSLHTSIDHAIQVFQNEKQMVLPVMDEQSQYLGSLTFIRILKEILYSFRGYVNIEIKNVIGDHQFESAKHQFISEMMHITKNPIQVILSAVDLLKEGINKEDFIILLNAIKTSAEQISVLFDKLLNKYLE